jgi:hypothetical protein
MSASSMPDRLITVIADGFVLEVACDDGRFDAVLAAVQGFLLALDVELALLTMEAGTAAAKRARDVERAQRAAALN